MSTPAMTRAQASLEMALWHADAEAMSSSDLYVWLRESGLPPEIAIRLKELVGFTAKVGTKVVSLGKIILVKLFEFIKKHQNLAVGMALGAAIASIVSSVPILGPILAPIVLPLGIIVGAIAGHRVDKANDHRINGDTSLVSLTQDVIEIAREFFELFVDTMRAVSDEISI
ncbi:MAG: hypothetical protein KBE28_05065 [Nitrospira sp.]|nr:hypothetical protein [Nitrospira sp.]